MSNPQGLTLEDRQNLVAYLDGELEEEAARTLEAKLSQNPVARQEAETLEKTWELLDYLPRPKASESFTQRTMTRLESRLVATAARQKRWRWIGVASWAAGVMAASVVGFLVSNRWPKPQPLPEPSAEDIRLLEHREYWPYYQKIDNIDFLRELAEPELFGEES